jgi:hypothetical protein
MANRHPGRRHQHRRVKYDGGRHHGFDGYRFVRVGFVRVVRFLKRFRFDRNLRLRHV